MTDRGVAVGRLLGARGAAASLVRLPATADASALLSAVALRSWLTPRDSSEQRVERVVEDVVESLAE